VNILHFRFPRFIRRVDIWLGSFRKPKPRSQVAALLRPIQPPVSPPFPKPIDYGFSPVTWIMEALARPRLDLQQELELVERLSRWKRRRHPSPWRAWSRAGPHPRKRRHVEYSPGMFRRVA